LSEPSGNSKVRLLGGVTPADKAPLPLPQRTPAQPPAQGASAAQPAPQAAPAVQPPARAAPAVQPPARAAQVAPPPPAPASPPPALAAPVQAEPILLCDSAEGADLLNTGEIVQPLARLCVAPQVQTPFLAAIAGPTGAGKSFALRRLTRAIEQFRAAPAASSDVALARVVVAQVDAAGGVEAPVAIASAAYAALDRAPGGVDYSALLDETGHSGGDPHRAASAASDRHDDLVRKLEAERSQRDDVEARRARLADVLLFETPGSRIDVFARANRGAIEGRLRRFGLAGSDAGLSFRSLVRDMATLGAGGRIAIVIRSIWGYGSQARLLFWAAVAFALAFGVNELHGDKAIGAIERGNDLLKPVAAWIEAHGDWFDRVSQVLVLLGALAIALNLWRALGFSNLLLRGARLLNHEARERRRDLDERAARLNQRVAALTTEAEAAARRAETASRRVGGKASDRAPGPEFLEASHGPSAAARAFLAALGGRIGHASATGPAPDRLIFVIDNLDALPPAAAVAWIDIAQGLIGPGCAGLLAFDPRRLAVALGGPRQARRRFGKWLQVTVNLSARQGADGERVVARLLSTSAQSAPPLDWKAAAALAEPLSAAETQLLASLAPLAAYSPRDAKRFLNAYRLARCSSLPRPVVALMQAVAFADDESQAAMRERLAKDSGDMADVAGPAALAAAIKAARAANGGAIPVQDARAAAEIARRYALPL
jgi:hypothetical protein